MCSERLGSMSATRSPLARPRAAKPAASSSTPCRVWAQVRVCQPVPSPARSDRAGAPPEFSAVSRRWSQIVRPSISRSISARCWSISVVTVSLPGHSPDPAGRPTLSAAPFRSCTNATTLPPVPQPSGISGDNRGGAATTAHHDRRWRPRAPGIAAAGYYGRPMASGSEHLSPGLPDYLVGHSTPPDALLRDLISETAERFPGNVVYQIGPEQGTFMTMLAGLMGARHVIEVGTFTGYSSICLARGMAADGKLICCDVSEE